MRLLTFTCSDHIPHQVGEAPHHDWRSQAAAPEGREPCVVGGVAQRLRSQQIDVRAAGLEFESAAKRAHDAASHARVHRRTYSQDYLCKSSGAVDWIRVEKRDSLKLLRRPSRSLFGPSFPSLLLLLFIHFHPSFLFLPDNHSVYSDPYT
jgi:hypothetical protein